MSRFNNNLCAVFLFVFATLACSTTLNSMKMPRIVMPRIVMPRMKMPTKVNIINDTDKSYFVITSFRSQNIYAGYLVIADSNKIVERVYIGRFDVDDYTNPEFVYIYNSFLDVSRDNSHNSADFLNYIAKIEVVKQIKHTSVEDTAIIRLSECVN